MEYEEIKSKMDALLSPESYFALEDTEVNGKTFLAFKNAEKNLGALLQQGRVHGEKECIVYEDTRWTFNQFYEQADAINYLIHDRFQLDQGESIAIAMRNCPDWASVLFGAIFAGTMVVPLNSWGKTDELLHGVRDSECRLLVCDRQRFDLIKDKVDSLGIQIIVVDNDIDLSGYDCVTRLDTEIELALGKTAGLRYADTDDVAIMLYTSGSTGSPKGVPLTHRAICQSIMGFFFGGAFTAATAADNVETERQMVNLLGVPLFHGTGLIAGLLVAVVAGIKTVMMYKWDVEKALALIEKEKITQTNAVPTLIQAFMSSEKFDQYDTSSLERIGLGGAAAATALPALIRSKLRNPVCGTGWGMTETAALGVSMGGASYDLKPHATGIKMPIIEIRIVGANGTMLPVGERGEIECRGITVFKGYWKNPEATKATFNGDWLKTGDVGYFDEDDYMYITGRSKDLVIRGGENIFPGDVEDACYQMDGVMEVAVYGVPDELLGEELAMNVMINTSSKLTEASIRDHLAHSIAAFKIPKYISVGTDPLPKNVANKIDKIKLKRQFTTVTRTSSP